MPSRSWVTRLGLVIPVPIASIWVTGALAIVSFLFYNITAFIKDPLGYLKHLTGGAPVFMWPIMIPVEIMGTLIKPFALAIRLFANMTGGHLVIAILLSFVGPVIQAMGGAGYPIAAVSVLGAVAINFLEILVAFIQAYIFTFLTCLFLGQLVVHEHDEHHDRCRGLLFVRGGALQGSRRQAQGHPFDPGGTPAGQRIAPVPLQRRG